MSTDPDRQNEEYSKLLLARYDDRHRSFVRTYTTFMAFGLAFLVFILVPMMSLSLDNKNLPLELVQQEQALASMQPVYEELQVQNGTFQRELNVLTPQLEAIGSQQAEKERQAREAREEVELIRIQLDESRRERSIKIRALGAARRALESGDFKVLEGALGRAGDTFLTEAQEHEAEISRLSTLEITLQESLTSADIDLTRIETQLLDFTNQMERLRPRAAAIVSSLEEVEENLRNTQKELDLGKEAITQISQRQIAIQDRLSTFQTPFGALPLSLTEASLAFPLIIAAGFLICSIFVASLLRLRGEYHRILSRNQMYEAEALRHRIVFVAPLWLDPLKTAWRNSGGLVLIFLPAIAFLVIVLLVITGQFFDLDANRLDRYLVRFYSAFYGVGVLLVILGSWCILAEWSSYRSMLTSEASSLENQD